MGNNIYYLYYMLHNRRWWWIRSDWSRPSEARYWTTTHIITMGNVNIILRCWRQIYIVMSEPPAFISGPKVGKTFDCIFEYTIRYYHVYRLVSIYIERWVVKVIFDTLNSLWFSNGKDFISYQVNLIALLPILIPNLILGKPDQSRWQQRFDLL